MMKAPSSTTATEYLLLSHNCCSIVGLRENANNKMPINKPNDIGQANATFEGNSLEYRRTISPPQAFPLVKIHNKNYRMNLARSVFLSSAPAFSCTSALVTTILLPGYTWGKEEERRTIKCHYF